MSYRYRLRQPTTGHAHTLCREHWHRNQEPPFGNGDVVAGMSMSHQTVSASVARHPVSSTAVLTVSTGPEVVDQVSEVPVEQSVSVKHRCASSSVPVRSATTSRDDGCRLESTDIDVMPGKHTTRRSQQKPDALTPSPQPQWRKGDTAINARTIGRGQDQRTTMKAIRVPNERRRTANFAHLV